MQDFAQDVLMQGYAAPTQDVRVMTEEALQYASFLADNEKAPVDELKIAIQRLVGHAEAVQTIRDEEKELSKTTVRSDRAHCTAVH